MPIAWHGPYDKLKKETQDMARAIQSLMEELEAIDWHGQRVDVTHDNGLREILEPQPGRGKGTRVYVIGVDLLTRR